MLRPVRREKEKRIGEKVEVVSKSRKIKISLFIFLCSQPRVLFSPVNGSPLFSSPVDGDLNSTFIVTANQQV